MKHKIGYLILILLILPITFAITNIGFSPIHPISSDSIASVAVFNTSITNYPVSTCSWEIISSSTTNNTYALIGSWTNASGGNAWQPNISFTTTNNVEDSNDYSYRINCTSEGNYSWNNSFPNAMAIWHFDNNSNYEDTDHIYDWSGNENNITLWNESIVLGLAGYNSSSYIQKLMFDNQRRGNITWSQALNLSTGNFSICAWVSTDNPTGSNYYISQYSNAGGSRSFAFGIDGNDILLKVFNATLSTENLGTNSNKINADTYYFVCAVHNIATGEANFYINGTLDRNQNGSVTGSYDDCDTPWSIGYGNGYNGYNVTGGSIDETYVFNQLLSADDVITLYYMGLEKYNTTVVTGVIVDNTVPNTPVQVLPSQNYTDAQSTDDWTFFANITQKNTTLCYLIFTGVQNPGVSTYAMTNNGANCSLSFVNIMGGDYTYKIRASDGTNVSETTPWRLNVVAPINSLESNLYDVNLQLTNGLMLVAIVLCSGLALGMVLKLVSDKYPEVNIGVLATLAGIIVFVVIVLGLGGSIITKLVGG